jgi:flagellar biosynthetic protein FliP
LRPFCWAVLLLLADPALAQTAAPPLGQPGALDRAVTTIAGDGKPLSLSLQILLLMSLLTVLPSLLLMMTSFTRIIIVLSILRQALGLQQTPPNQVLVGLALFLSLFVMKPVVDQINATAYTPYGDGQISIEEAVSRSGTALHGFMLKQTREGDLKLFADLAEAKPFARPQDVPFSILLPAFVTSELKTAFQIGFLIFLPIPHHRSRRRLGADGAWHDDAVADDRVDAIQAAAVRAGRRLGPHHGLACCKLRDVARGHPRLFRRHRAAGAVDPGARLRPDPDPGFDHRHPARHGPGGDLDQRADALLRPKLVVVGICLACSAPRS